MARSSLIGSPLLNIIRTGVYPSSQGVSPSTIPPTVRQFLNATSPRALTEAMTQAFVLDVMVSVFPSVATRGGFLAKTTFLTSDYKGRSRLVTEYWWSLASHHSQLQLLTGQRLAPSRFHTPGGAASYRVWTLPGITKQARKVQPALSSDGLVLEASHA